MCYICKWFMCILFSIAIGDMHGIICRISKSTIHNAASAKWFFERWTRRTPYKKRNTMIDIFKANQCRITKDSAKRSFSITYITKRKQQRGQSNADIPSRKLKGGICKSEDARRKPENGRCINGTARAKSHLTIYNPHRGKWKQKEW